MSKNRTLCIGDTRRIIQVKLAQSPHRFAVIDEWEFKALYNYVDDDSQVVLCEGTNWDLAENMHTNLTKLQTYVWNNIGDSDVWG